MSSDGATGGTGVPTTSGTDPSATAGGPTGAESEAGTCESSSGGADPECPTDVEECSLEHQICALGLTEFADDYGVVEMADDLTKWQAAHDCALAASNELRMFKLIADQFGFDSLQTEAYVAEDACPYAITKVHFDNDPCGGEGCGPTVFVSSCAALAAEPGCTIEPGDVCLRCGLPGEGTQVCGP